MHMVVAVALDPEQKWGRSRVPRVLLCDRLVDASCILLAQKAVVLGVVDQLDEEYADEAVAELENYCALPKNGPN